METSRFDAFTRSLAGSRRALLGGMLAAAAGWAGMAGSDARKKRKRKKRRKKATPNAFGCLEVNDPCTSPAQCCSGVCEGKKCRSHDTGTCDQTLRKEICLAASVEDILVLRGCDSDLNCYCYRTTSGSRYCSAGLLNEGDPRCADCKTDADCVALGFPPAAACAPVSQGLCAGSCPTGMACLTPCGAALPNPAP
jgi:hypothetical protein